MREFNVTIKEELSRTIMVVAENETEAEKQIREKYRNREIILSADDYVDTEFVVE